MTWWWGRSSCRSTSGVGVSSGRGAFAPPFRTQTRKQTPKHPNASTPKGPLPTDFKLLHEEAGLRSFVAVAIGPPGAAPLGALLLGKARPNGFADQW